jgi:hypothetical protein
LILFDWDPGGYFPEITNVMLEIEASYWSTQGICYCGASAWSTHCNVILNVGIPFQYPLYVAKSCGKQRKLNGGNVNVVSGVGTLFQNGVAKSRASTVAHMNQMVLHVTVHWPAAHLELKPSTLSYGWCEFNHKPHQCKDKSPEEAVVGTKLDVVIIPAYILQQQLVLSVVNATAVDVVDERKEKRDAVASYCTVAYWKYSSCNCWSSFAEIHLSLLI